MMRAACLALAVGYGAADAEAGAQPPPVEADVAAGLLTLRARSTSLAEVFLAIGRAGSFTVVLSGRLDESVSISFRDRPLAEALRELGRSHSVVLLVGSSEPNGIRELRVYENRRGPRRDDAIANAPPEASAIVAALGVADAAARALAVPKASLLPPREAARALSGVLTDRHAEPQIRSRAVATLSKVQGPEASRLLQHVALSERDAPVRMQALRALAAKDGGRAVQTLGLALQIDREPGVRAAAVAALARLGGNEARVQVEHAAVDRSDEVRRAARQALTAWAKPSG